MPRANRKQKLENQWFQSNDVVVFPNHKEMPLEFCIMNPDYIPELDAFGFNFDNETMYRFIEAFIHDQLKLVRDCSPTSKQYKEVIDFIDSELFLLYTAYIGLDGEVLRKGALAMKQGRNFSDDRCDYNDGEGLLHYQEQQAKADARFQRVAGA